MTRSEEILNREKDGVQEGGMWTVQAVFHLDTRAGEMRIASRGVGEPRGKPRGLPSEQSCKKNAEDSPRLREIFVLFYILLSNKEKIK